MNENQEIWIITEQPLDTGARSGRDIGGVLKPSQSIESVINVRTSVSVETLKKEVEVFLSNLGHILGHTERQLEQQKTAMHLDEVALSIEISAEGQISLFGTGGKTGGKGAITLKFKRKEGA
jgi:hypothetical protein